MKCQFEECDDDGVFLENNLWLCGRHRGFRAEKQVLTGNAEVIKKFIAIIDDYE